MLSIEIAPLRRGVNKLELRPSPERLELEPGLFSDIAVDADVDVRPGQIVVRFDASACAHLICDRTLRPFTQQVSGSYAVLFTPREEIKAEGIEDVRLYSSSDRTLDITEVVRDTLILALPTKRIAPGADDIEIPNRFADEKEEDVDPRWEALRRLRQ